LINPAAVGARAAAGTQAEVLLRGPVHEAFAAQVHNQVKVGGIVNHAPPAAIREIPPQLRPGGEGVSWIPGYWNWDDERGDFLWVSGTWRKAPPGHRWMPGYWSPSGGGFCWVAGAWLPAEATAISYLPALPRDDRDEGPSGPPPGDKSCWIPGCWNYQDNDYRWRPGYWSDGQADWIWTPEHYVVTPRGAIHVAGFWDYRLDDRGLLFAPVRFAGQALGGVPFVPEEAIDVSRMITHWFVGPERHHYYCGDYYGPESVKAGFTPWFERREGEHVFDALFAQYAWRERQAGIDLAARLKDWHAWFLDHRELRPPRTLEALGRFTLHNKDVPYSEMAILGRPLGDLAAASARTAAPLVQVSGRELGAVIGVTEQLQGIAAERLNVEALAGTAQGAADRALQLPQVANPLAVPLPVVGGVGVGATVQGTLQGGVQGIGGAVLGGQGVIRAGAQGDVEANQGGGILGGVLGGRNR
jgi:hypothetical protein